MVGIKPVTISVLRQYAGHYTIELSQYEAECHPRHLRIRSADLAVNQTTVVFRICFHVRPFPCNRLSQRPITQRASSLRVSRSEAPP
jgi:hypothetical protein